MPKVSELTEEQWLSFQQTLEIAREQKDFTRNLYAQAALLVDAARFYHVVTPLKQQGVLSGLLALQIPCVNMAARPRDYLEDLLEVARRWGIEEVTRTLRSAKPSSVIWVAQPDELSYPQTGWIGDYLEWAKRGEAPLGWHFWAAVTALGAACRWNWYIDRGQYSLRLNNYVVLVGAKGSAKSHVQERATDIVDKANDIITEQGPSPFEIRRLPEDTNVETLTARLEYHEMYVGEDLIPQESTGLLVLDELTTFLSKDTWNEGRRIPWLTTMYAKSRHDYETKSGGKIHLRKLALSMLAATAPEWITDAMTPLLMRGGFTDRVQFVYREHTGRDYPTPDSLDSVVAYRLAKQLVHLTTNREPTELRATKEALEWYNDWYLRQPREAEDSEVSRARMSNRVWKLGALLSLSCGREPWIEPPLLQGAADYLMVEETNYWKFIKSMERSTKNDPIHYILKVLARNKGEMKHAELMNYLRGRRELSPPKTKAMPYVYSMIEMGLITSSSGGRRGTLYKLTNDGVKELKS